jgi:hypothetical protein
MIDVSDYISKLEVLKEYMGLVIDCGGGCITTDLLGFPIIEIFKPSDFFRVYDKLGIMYQRINPIEPSRIFFSFEEYYQSKTINT